MSHSPTRAVIARFGVRSAHDADDQLARREAAASRRLNHFAQRFVAENEAVLARRRLAVSALDDLDVGAADPDGQPPDQDRPSAGSGGGTSSSSAEFAIPGCTASAFIGPLRPAIELPALGEDALDLGGVLPLVVGFVLEHAEDAVLLVADLPDRVEGAS